MSWYENVIGAFWQRRRQRQEEDEKCAICMDALNDPVTLSCFHVFCRSCISENENKRIRSFQETFAAAVFGLITVLCPLCRDTIYRATKQELRFPEPLVCSSCNGHITKVVRFPCCGRTNNDKCISCVTGEAAGKLQCPTCRVGFYFETILPSMRLCVFCHKYLLWQEVVCQCQMQREDRKWSAERTGAGILRSTNAIRQRPNYMLWLLVLLGLALLLWYGIPMLANIHTRGKSNIPGQIRICVQREMWIANKNGQAYKTKCKSGEVKYRRIPNSGAEAPNRKRNAERNKKFEKPEDTEQATKREKMSGDKIRNEEPENARQNDSRKQGSGQIRDAEKVTTKTKRGPVYLKDCYPIAVWKVTPEGEVHTKKCETVLMSDGEVKG